MLSRPQVCGLAVVIGIAVSLVGASATAAQTRRVLRAGGYAADITPKYFPVSSNGSMSDRQATEAHDPLHARCLVLHNGDTGIAIVVCDNCMIPRDIFDAAKCLAAERTGIPVGNMLMSATHTHSGVTVTGVFQSVPEERYREFLIQKIADGVEQAHKQLQLARIGWAAADDPSQVFNRRWFTKEGVVNRDPFGRTDAAVRMNPGFDKDITDRPSGPIDPQIAMLSVQNLDGAPIALLANYSLHYVGGVEGHALSADYFAEFANLMAQKIDAGPAFVGIMSNGTSGNINNINYAAESYLRKPPYEQMRFVAASVADAAYSTYQGIEYLDWVRLSAAQTELTLGVRLPPEDDLVRAHATLEAAGPRPLPIKRSDLRSRDRTARGVPRRGAGDRPGTAYRRRRDCRDSVRDVRRNRSGNQRRQPVGSDVLHLARQRLQRLFADPRASRMGRL